MNTHIKLEFEQYEKYSTWFEVFQYFILDSVHQG